MWGRSQGQTSGPPIWIFVITYATFGWFASNLGWCERYRGTSTIFCRGSILYFFYFLVTGPHWEFWGCHVVPYD
jgi:hypothetical protein